MFQRHFQSLSHEARRSRHGKMCLVPPRGPLAPDHAAPPASQIARRQARAARAAVQALPQAASCDVFECRIGKDLSNARGAAEIAAASTIFEMDPKAEA